MRRATPEINAGSMADIAFLLLIFFLVTTTMDVDTGITRRLPPPLETEEQEMDIKERNIFKILVNSADRLLVEGKPGDIRNLKEDTKIFFLNPADDPNLPEKQEMTIPELGDIMVSKGVVSLKNDRGTSYDMYIMVQNELAKAFNEMRDELSVQYFGARFNQLVDTAKINAVQKAIPIAISEAEPEDVGQN